MSCQNAQKNVRLAANILPSKECNDSIEMPAQYGNGQLRTHVPAHSNLTSHHKFRRGSLLPAATKSLGNIDVCDLCRSEWQSGRMVSPGQGRPTKASGRLKTTSVMQTLSGLFGRLSQGESDFTLPPEGSSEGRVGLILPPAHLKNTV